MRVRRALDCLDARADNLCGATVGTGLVASLARPGGNITGLSIQQTDLASKRLEILREVLPSLRTVAILFHIGSPNSVLEMGEAQAAARRGLAATSPALPSLNTASPENGWNGSRSLRPA
jgi:ABC-type uncharacterized transport system substrate-binding protein